MRLVCVPSNARKRALTILLMVLTGGSPCVMAVTLGLSGHAHCLAPLNTQGDALSALITAYSLLLPSRIPLEKLKVLAMDPWTPMIWPDGAIQANQGDALAILRAHYQQMDFAHQQIALTALQKAISRRIAEGGHQLEKIIIHGADPRPYPSDVYSFGEGSLFDLQLSSRGRLWAIMQARDHSDGKFLSLPLGQSRIFTEIPLGTHNSKIIAANLSIDENQLLVLSSEDSSTVMFVTDLQTQKQSREVSIKDGSGLDPQAAFSTDGSLRIFFNRTKAIVYDRHMRIIYASDPSVDKPVAFVPMDGKFRLYMASKGGDSGEFLEVSQTRDLRPGLRARIRRRLGGMNTDVRIIVKMRTSSIARGIFSPDGSQLVAQMNTRDLTNFTAKQYLEIFDVASAATITTIDDINELPIQILTDGHMLTRWKTTLALVNWRHPENSFIGELDDQELMDVQISRDQKWIAAIFKSASNTLVVFDVEQRARIADFPHRDMARFSPDSKWLLIGRSGSEGRIDVFPLSALEDRKLGASASSPKQ